MLFNGIEIADALVQASYEGNLVIFAGAGVSVGEPTNLPNFEDLTTAIQKSVAPLGDAQERGQHESYGHYLGYLEKEFGGVHEACAQIIGGDRKAAPIHQHIVDLFRKTPTRIVTTNFDHCFENALASAGRSASVFSGPALPLGDDFSGLAHLHGDVSVPDEQVLTDIDFADAYVTKSWASRFLVDMFATYTVLFVGYSGNDELVDYLTRSVAANSKGTVFALVKEDNEAQAWDDRGVTPVRYSNHGLLPGAFKAWADHLSSSLYSRASRAKAIAELGPGGLTREDEDFLNSAFQTSMKDDHLVVRAFCDAARDSDWLKWLIAQNYARVLYMKELTRSEEALQDWVATNCVTASLDDIMSVRSEAGRPLSPSFIQKAFRHLEDIDASAAQLKAWLHLAKETSPEIADPYFRRCVLNAASKSGDPSVNTKAAILLLIVQGTTEPALKIAGSYFGREVVEFIAQEPCDTGAVFTHALQQLETCYEILTHFDEDSKYFDSLSSNVQDFYEEPEEYDDFASPHKLLLRVILSIAPKVSTEAPGLFAWCTDRCLQSPYELIQRLGYYFLPLTNLTHAEQISRLTSHHSLQQTLCRSEVYKLIKELFALSSPAQQTALIQYVCDELPVEVDDEHVRERNLRKRFDIFSLLTSEDRPNSSIEEQIQLIKEDYPEWQTRKHPGRLWWTSSLTLNSDVACHVDEEGFTYAYCRDVVDEAKPIDISVTPDGLMRYGIEKYPFQAIQIGEQCIREDTDELDVSILAHIVNSLNWPQAFEKFRPAALSLLHSMLLREEHFTDTLRAISFATSSSTPSNSRLTLEELASILNALLTHWEAIAIPPTPTSDDEARDWVSEAINHPIGHFVNLLMKAFEAAVASEDQGALMHLEATVEPYLAGLAEDDATSPIAAAALFLYANFWAQNFPQFFTHTMMPALHSEYPAHEAAWSGLGWSSAWCEEVWTAVRAPLSERFRLKSILDESLSEQLAALYAWCLIVLEDDAHQKHNLLTICLASTDSIAKGAIQQIRNWLEYLNDPQEEVKAWNEWLRPTLETVSSAPKCEELLFRPAIRWLNISQELDTLIVSYLNTQTIPPSIDLFMTPESISAICDNRQITNNEKAKAILLFLRCRACYLPNDLQAAFDKIDWNAIDAELKEAIRDELVKCDEPDWASRIP